MSRRPIKSALGLAVAAAAVLMAAGCTEYLERRETISFHAGDAVAANRAIHTIDPWPPYASNTRLETSGRRVAGAIERYETRQPNGGGGGPMAITLPLMPAPGGPAP
jgi:hypothetical protein